MAEHPDQDHRHSGRSDRTDRAGPTKQVAPTTTTQADPTAQADPSWATPVSGNWSVAANWSPPGVPAAFADVTINATGIAYTVTYDEPVEVLTSLSIGASNATLTLDVPGSILLVSSDTDLTAGTIDIVAPSGAPSGATLITDALNASPATVIDVANDGLLDAGVGFFAEEGLLESTSGVGTVLGDLVGVGTVEAAGGTLAIDGPVISDSLHFQVSNNKASALVLNSTVADNNTFTFLGPAGETAFTDDATALKANVVGLNVGTSGTISTNFVSLSSLTGDWTVTGSNEHAGTGPVTVQLSNGTVTDTLTLSGITGSASGTWFVNTDVIGDTTDVFLSVVCYARGTMLRTPDGELPVEKLRAGKQVITLVDGQETPKTVTWLGRRRVDLARHSRPETVAPVRIRRDAFADGIPHRDLIVSPDHAIFVDGKLICARQLVNGTTIRQEVDWTAVDYYHVELDQHGILLAEGLPAESYIDTGNSGFFENSGAPLVLYPDLTDETDYPTRQAGSCAPFVWDEASVRPVWQRLADRATAIGLPVPQRSVTTEPNLRLRGKLRERQSKPIYADSKLALFVLPRGVSQVHLLSHSQSPTEARPWLDDRRRLGVRVRRIVLRGANELREVPMDHPDLTKGWWDIERDGQMMSRWTDGDAVVPLPKMDGHVMLEVHLAGEMIYTIEAAAENLAA